MNGEGDRRRSDRGRAAERIDGYLRAAVLVGAILLVITQLLLRVPEIRTLIVPANAPKEYPTKPDRPVSIRLAFLHLNICCGIICSFVRRRSPASFMLKQALPNSSVSALPQADGPPVYSTGCINVCAL